MRGTTTNVRLILDLDQEAGLARQTAERPEHTSPTHGAITRQPMTVRVAVGILNVDMGEVVAGGIDVIVDRWRTGGNMRVMRMSGIDRNTNHPAVKGPREEEARSRIFFLYVFDDEFAPDVFGTLHDVLERRVDPFGECMPGPRIDIQIVVIPCRERRVDNHLGRTDKLARLKALQKPLGNDGADEGILACCFES